MKWKWEKWNFGIDGTWKIGGFQYWSPLTDYVGNYRENKWKIQ